MFFSSSLLTEDWKAVPEEITLPVKAGQILRVMCSEDNRISLEDGNLTVELKAPFEAIAVYMSSVES